LVLTSPFGVSTGYQDRRIQQWRAAGVTVAVSTGDVTDLDETRTLLHDAASMCRDGVGSVVNLAVILHDGLTANQTPADWSRATKPKVSPKPSLLVCTLYPAFFVLKYGIAHISNHVVCTIMN